MMRIKHNTITEVTILVLALCIASVQARTQPKAESSPQEATDISWNYDGSNRLPAGWKIEGTNQDGPLASWQIVRDQTAPSGENTLAMLAPNHNSGGTFNLCWTEDVQFLNGAVEVVFKALEGIEDQGGGVIWRVQDKDNYYIARFNPLEDNFRIYTVRNGSRKMIASEKIALTAGEWHSLKVVQQGNRFQGYLDGEKILDGENNWFPRPGGVGLWTKADAVTSFDNFSVQLFDKNERSKRDK